jgi:uncharacterized protein (DUF342 family)
MDVYGDPIPGLKAKDLKLRVGKGAILSEDGLTITAETEGRPQLSVGKKVSVLASYEVQGDVDLKTGHVDFHGDIRVTGAVQNGFKVKGGSLEANEILGADIDVQGDVVALRGILGATIKTQGSIRAKYIRKAHVMAIGDVEVEKEVIESEIETGGTCRVGKGNIIASRVTAKKGIEVLEMGSQTSNPCTLIIGTDDRVINEIHGMKDLIEEKKTQLEKMADKVDKLHEKVEALNQDIGEKAQVQDRSMVNLRKLQDREEALKEGGSPEQVEKVMKMIGAFDAEIKLRDEELEKLFEKQDQVSEEMNRIKQQVEDTKLEILDLTDEIEAISAWSRDEKGRAEVKVRGKVYQFTTIKGKFASLRLPESHSGLLIKEVKTSDPNNKKGWKIKLGKLA